MTLKKGSGKLILHAPLPSTGLPPNVSNEGASISPLLKQPTSEQDRTVTTTCGKGNHAIQSRRYHFYQYEDGSNELYDQAEDPTEWHNLASSMQHQPVIAKLLQKLPKEDAEPSVLNEYPTNEHFLSK